MKRYLTGKSLILFFTLCALTTGVGAQTYPSRPIRMISPNPPGGANDTIGRIVAATMAGETQFYFGPMASMVSQVKAGKLKPLAVGGTKRSPTVPDVPTVAEAGIPAYQSFGWFGLLAPAKTQKAVIVRLNQAVADAVNSPDVTQKFLQLGVDPVHNTPEEFGKFIADQLVRYRKTVKDLDIKVE